VKRILIAGLLAAFVLPLVGSASSARAIAIRLVPLPERVATADAIVVGKVTTIEDKTVSAEPFPGQKDKVEYHIAVVKIGDGLQGAKGLTHLKIGFIKPATPAGGGTVPIRPIRGGFVPPQPAVDQEGCYFLSKHHAENFYVMRDNNSFINKAGNANFDKDVAKVKELAKLLADPKKGLKSKSAEDRSQTAAMLVVRYTMQHPGQNKQVPIDAEESKLILQGLADGDWTKGFSPTELTPQMVFGRLGLTDKDGWAPGPLTTPNAFQDAAKAWIKGHAESYRIQRWTTEEKKEK
jgi:hypothetical protein